ncbi:pilus assembly protein [Marinomonas sp. 15G1-11]|uniref:Pilus assembly protein n=1 Tax=Marinomonas phaeophyticola TaxID=3004091 RepID=A0ABT4JYN5_9GAMM|nr:TadE family protein [Marinomonas sp. 15G1-11]MCZ2722868.1 pilus assembly protein [Marinomonas sp. 15G1-11]
MKKLLVSRKDKKGVVAIEFALGFFAFVSLFLLWGEMAVMGFFSSVLDYSVSEASREVRTTSAEDYKAEFVKRIKTNNDLWSNFIDTNKFTISVKYYDDIGSIADDKNFGHDNATLSTLAVYKIDYDYTPVFSLFYDDGTVKLSRQVINLQEYERNEFTQ